LKPFSDEHPDHIVKEMLAIWINPSLRASLSSTQANERAEKIIQILLSLRIRPATVINAVNQALKDKRFNIE
jgi:hypothetical protein